VNLVEERGGAVYDRGYRPYEGPRGGGRGDVHLYKASMPVRSASGGRGAKVAPFHSSDRHDPGIVNVGIGYVTQPLPHRAIQIIAYREYVGVSAALLLFVVGGADVVCPDRRQHVLPLMFARPITGVDYVPRSWARRVRSCSRFAPSAGRALRRQHAVSAKRLDYFTGHLTCSGKCR
jgi:hypothetical protein